MPKKYIFNKKSCAKFLFFYQKPVREAYGGHSVVRSEECPSKTNSWLRLCMKGRLEAWYHESNAQTDKQSHETIVFSCLMLCRCGTEFVCEWWRHSDWATEPHTGHQQQQQQHPTAATVRWPITSSLGTTIFHGMRNFEPSHGICPFPRNFYISAEFLHFRGISRNLVPAGD